MEVLMRINDMKLRNLFGKDLKMPEKMAMILEKSH
jgi:hypothetical protein